ncbi:MAG: MoaD/ThiS family protein [Planctomycetia bacterium]|nr:MoaD/ThiS family protein [Planctomycetia bacterium]
MRVRVVFTGRGYDEMRSLPSELDLPDAATIDEALSRLSAHLRPGAKLPPTCLVTVSGAHLGSVASHVNRGLRDGDEIVLIAPVAGG